MQQVHGPRRLHAQHCACDCCRKILARQGQYRLNVGTGLLGIAFAVAAIIAVPGRAIITIIGRAVGLPF